MFNQKILSIIEELQKKSDYEQEHKDEFLEKDRMLAITRNTGEFYNLLLKSIGAKRVLEIGLSHGYSTLWFADAILSENFQDSCIITIENDLSKIKIAKENFVKASVENFVKIKHGDGITILNEMLDKFNKTHQKSYFDFVFIDADKENSIRYFELCFPMVRKNGLITADNILDMKEMKEYVKYVKNRLDVQTITLSCRMGSRTITKDIGLILEN